MKIGIGLLMVLWVGCFAGRDRMGSDRETLRCEVEFVEVDEGLEGSVLIDSFGNPDTSRRTCSPHVTHAASAHVNAADHLVSVQSES